MDSAHRAWRAAAYWTAGGALLMASYGLPWLVYAIYGGVAVSFVVRAVYTSPRGLRARERARESAPVPDGVHRNRALLRKGVGR